MPMDAVDEEQSRRLLQPTSENLANVKVFPLIPSLKKDVAVSHDAWKLSWIQTREVLRRETSVRAVAVCIRITKSLTHVNSYLDTALTWEYVSLL